MPTLCPLVQALAGPSSERSGAHTPLARAAVRPRPRGVRTLRGQFGRSAGPFGGVEPRLDHREQRRVSGTGTALALRAGAKRARRRAGFHRTCEHCPHRTVPVGRGSVGQWRGVDVGEGCGETEAAPPAPHPPPIRPRRAGAAPRVVVRRRRFLRRAAGRGFGGSSRTGWGRGTRAAGAIIRRPCRMVRRDQPSGSAPATWFPMRPTRSSHPRRPRRSWARCKRSSSKCAWWTKPSTRTSTRKPAPVVRSSPLASPRTKRSQNRFR